MSVQIDWNVVGDADLVGAAIAGDRAAFAGIYDRYADRLYDFCVGMVGASDAADCVQEAFCQAAVALPALRDPDKLRPWLYSIVRHQALRALRARKRELTSDELPEAASPDAGPDVLAARNELAELVAQAEGGLSDRDREVLNLAYRHGLTGSELAQALDVGNESAKKMVQRLRDTVEKSLGALLVVRQVDSGHNDCPDMAAIVAGWDGQFTILLRKRVSRHIESCPNCDEQRGRLVNPRALLGSSAVFVPAPLWLREHTLNQVQLAPATASGAVGTAAHGTARLSLLSGRFVLWAAALVAVPSVALGVTIGLPALRDVQSPTIQIPQTGPSLATSVTTTTAVPESPAPLPQPNLSTPQPNLPMSPAGGPTGENTPDTSIPDTTVPGAEPGGQAPSEAPAATAAPNATTAPSTTHSAPTARRSASSVAPQPQRPKQPPAKHCPDGSTVTGGDSCPTPPPTSQAPVVPPQCPHIAVQDGPTCGRTGSGG
ncbi:sigma-70 family RNA polymerase sigma factor [Mycolicibacterium sp. P9-64]|uniref:sigma-70 family RNA polymerase sigma factor n=1 Tax=Mycolicibacterium sp. P9-64 TaxID=2024612 RepID=UPI0011ECC79A|nr:sigma-70 family RNA polymerase sigma factor [Mycolicibacterium sp. P9-64]KAA0077184.1 sigma-70 family RNA polymerase sigma factor [Mycolicibacterium sp. P9-64]